MVEWNGAVVKHYEKQLSKVGGFVLVTGIMNKLYFYLQTVGDRVQMTSTSDDATMYADEETAKNKAKFLNSIGKQQFVALEY